MRKKMFGVGKFLVGDAINDAYKIHRRQSLNANYIFVCAYEHVNDHLKIRKKIK